MYTVCPQCSSVHRLGAAELAARSGEVCCGRCGETFNALDRLYDDYPDGRRSARGRVEGADPPEVGRKPAPGFPAEPDEAPVTPRTTRWPWIAALTVLALATAVNVAWTLRDVVPRDGALARALHSLSVPGFEPPAPFRDPARIHLVTRDIHDHPTRAGVLVLSATFINLADRAQPYPELAVTLKNADDRPVAARVFTPADYLVEAPGLEALLAPNQQVPILLEFAEPDERATGFELDFR